MPFQFRPITPTNLSDKCIPTDTSKVNREFAQPNKTSNYPIFQVENELEYITNQTLVQAMRQLACLLKQVTLVCLKYVKFYASYLRLMTALMILVPSATLSTTPPTG